MLIFSFFLMCSGMNTREENTTLSLSYRSWYQICFDSPPTPASLTWQVDRILNLSNNWAICETLLLLFTSSGSLNNQDAFSGMEKLTLLVWSGAIASFLFNARPHLCNRVHRACQTAAYLLLDACHYHNYRRGLEEKIQRNLVFLKSSCILILILFGWSKVVLERRVGRESVKERGRKGFSGLEIRSGGRRCSCCSGWQLRLNALWCISRTHACQTSILFNADVKRSCFVMKQATFSRHVWLTFEVGRDVNTLYYVGFHWYPRRTTNFGSVGDFLPNTFKR